MWDKLHHNFGQIIGGETVTTRFKYSGERIIKSVTPSCKSCSRIVREDNEVIVSVKVRKLPTNGQIKVQYMNKRVTVIFTEGEPDQLTMSGMIVRGFRISL